MKKKVLHIGVVCFFFLSLTNCNYFPEKVDAPFFCGTDSYQREITLKEEPQRIISLSPGITEMLFLLESSDKLVGVSNYCNYPPEALSITRIGGMQNVNIEKLISLNPDLVLFGSIVPKTDVEKMEKAGLKLFALKGEKKMEEFFDALECLGEIVNKKELAEKQIKNYQARISALENEHKNQNKTVYYVVSFGTGGDFTAPKNSHINEIITLAGGINIGAEILQWSISREYLFERNPDFIFIRTEELDNFINTHPYTLLKAVKEKQVYPIESGWIDIISPRNLLAAEYINSVINRVDQ